MNLLRPLIHAYLFLPYCFQKFRKTGAFGTSGPTYITAPIHADGNRLKAALVRHYVKQYHDAACSVASVVTVVNALRSGTGDNPSPISQQEILERVNVGHWKERMGPGGHNGRRGLPLPLLGEVVRGSLAVYGMPHITVETVRIDARHKRAAAEKATLRRRLSDFEARGNSLIIAHFNQGAYVPALGIPHISPVGGFDARSGRVTLLDVDPDQPGPYTVGFDTFYRGLASTYNPVFRHFGYLSGGYIYLKQGA